MCHGKFVTDLFGTNYSKQTVTYVTGKDPEAMAFREGYTRTRISP